jgi:hypothetical protein
MVPFPRLLIAGYALLLTQLLPAQHRNANWVFGAGVWFQFPDSLPEVVPIHSVGMSILPLDEQVSLHSACISDTSGQFMLLADDHGIRNGLFQEVVGGGPVDLGWSVPAANYLILPVPGFPDQYGIFINEQPPSSRGGYVEVDLAANGGAGAVATNDMLWYMEHVTAKLSATVDAAETGYWLVQHADSGDAFQAYHFSASGLDTVPVVSHAGSPYLPETTTFENVDRTGQMIFSPTGTLLATVKNGPSPDTSKVELFQFDRSTGQVSHWADLGMRHSLYPGGPMVNAQARSVRGMDFSPTGDYLYLQLLNDFQQQSNTYVQYSLATPDSIAEHALSWLIVNVPLDSTCFDPQGSGIAVGEGGQLLLRICYDPATQSGQSLNAYMTLPLILGSGTGQHSTFPVYGIAPIGGFPSPCKRYVELAPITGGLEEGSISSDIDLRPNPLVDKSALFVQGNARPESVIWRDLSGRVVQRSAVGRIGPTYILERQGLPAGLYLVEVTGRQGSLGVVRVMCE